MKEASRAWAPGDPYTCAPRQATIGWPVPRGEALRVDRCLPWATKWKTKTNELKLKIICPGALPERALIDRAAGNLGTQSMLRGEAPDPAIQDQPVGRMAQKRSRWEMYFCVFLTGGEKKVCFRGTKQGEKWRLMEQVAFAQWSLLGAGKGQALLTVLPIGLGVRKTRRIFFFIVVVFLHQTSPYSSVTSDSWEEKEEPSASLLGDSSYHCVPLFCAPPGLKLG